jgi:hypothetical protein
LQGVSETAHGPDGTGIGERRLYVAYDVSSHKARRRIVKLLTGYGVRLQRSVFACDLTRAQECELLDRLRRLYFELESGRHNTKGQVLSVVVLFQCAGCAANAQFFGDKSLCNEDYIVV